MQQPSHMRPIAVYQNGWSGFFQTCAARDILYEEQFGILLACSLSTHSTEDAMPKVPKIFGYSLDKLPAEFRAAVETYTKVGAVKRLGEIESVEIKTKGAESPVHKSHYNPNDREDILSVRMKPLDKTKGIFTHHVYSDGTGTFKKGDKREFSSGAERRE
ncbi:hypothetical protein IWZ03DRAFT_241147 [Phyllosticta citriasiana]|uniref:Uncharacterized protein n=1 Tax=Phyllosticta citriasiana TaxID=595635 RepID=A0ABR1KFF9_9PEZI